MANVKDLLTLEEAQIELKAEVAAANDLVIAADITRVTELLETEAGREFVLRDGNDVTEDHDLATPQGFLQLRLFPVLSVTSVFMGVDATDAIDSDAYVVDTKGGQIIMKNSTVTPGRPGVGFVPGFVDFPEDAWRLSGRHFPAGAGGGKVVYRGGYEDTDSVDGGLKMIALDILARWYRQRERKSQGKTQEVAQGLSIASKWQPDLLTREMKLRLQRFVNRSETAR